ncbi:MAG: Ig-like domain-containing protein, partial [Candidatus Nanohalobium sp.]
MQEGLYNITYTVKDGAGNTVSRRINATLDKTRPSVNLISPDPSSIQSGNFSINASYQDDLSGVGSAKYYIRNSSGVQRSGGLNATVNSSKLAGGSYTLKLKVNDTAGNAADTNIDFKIDNSAPEVISRTLNLGMNVTGLIDINITVSDISGLDTARFRWYNSSGYVTAWKAFNYTGFDTASLDTGSYNVSVRLNDSLGHVRFENISDIAVDNTAPVLELKEYNLTRKYRGWIKDYKKVGVSCTDQGTGSQNISFSRESRINSSSTTPANFTAETHGNHSYTFKCTDYVGNKASVQRRYSIDAETPQVTSVAPEEGSKTARNVTINADFQSEASEAGLNESASSLQASKGDLKNVEWSNSSFTAEIKGLDYSKDFSLTGSIEDNLGHSYSVDLAYSVKSKPEGSSTSLPGGTSNSTNSTNSSEPQTIFEKTEKGLEVRKIQLEEGEVETVNLSNYTSGIVSKVLLKGGSSGLVGLRASKLDESGFEEPLGTVANRYFRMEVLNPYRVENVVLKFKVDRSWL